MRQRKTVCVDIDNTLADYTRALREWMRGFSTYQEYELPDPDEYNFERATGWPFYFRQEFVDAHLAAVKDGLYLAEKPYPHAVDALNGLQDEWRIIIATTRADDWNGDTMRWLHHYLVPYDSVLFGCKEDVRADVWLEDNPNTLQALAEHGRPALHPDHEYCRQSPGSILHWESLRGDLERELRKHRG